MKDENNCEIALKRILMATDGSAQAFKAVGYAIEIAKACGAEITLLMVADLDQHVSAFERVSLSGYVPAELKIAAYQFLADLMHVIPAEIPAHTRVEIGEPAETIVDVAAEEESDLIVLGSRGMSSIRTLLTGSVSHYVLKHAYCPVFISKGMPDDYDWENEEGSKTES